MPANLQACVNALGGYKMYWYACWYTYNVSAYDAENHNSLKEEQSEAEKYGYGVDWLQTDILFCSLVWKYTNHPGK